MFKLQNAEVDEARQALEKHGIVSFVPPPPEWSIAQANWDKVRDHVTDLDLDTYDPYIRITACQRTRAKLASIREAIS